MPELPEVETVRRGLAPLVEGARIEKVVLNRADLRFPFPAGFAAALEGATIETTARRAKYLLFRLSTGKTFYEKYRWIGYLQDDVNLVEVVQKILSIVDDDPDEPITSVTQSSTWAVCMAYLDYKNGTCELNQEDLDYTRHRGGVIGSDFVNGEYVCVTIREILESKDPGFIDFSDGIKCVSGA